MGIIKQGVRHGRKVRAAHVRRQAEQPFHLLLVGVDETDRAALARFFVPETLTRKQREQALRHISAGPGETAEGVEIAIFTPAAAHQPALLNWMRPGPVIVLDPESPQPGLEQLLKECAHLRLALGHAFPELRDSIARMLIRACALRNASVAAVSALPEVIPSPVSLVWAVGEMASDTVVLTANQIRLAFELAALNGHEVGWLAQRGQVLSIIAGAFGWRALARQVVSFIPGGVGVVTKAGIAYSGTWTVGASLWRMHRRRPLPVAEKEPTIASIARTA